MPPKWEIKTKDRIKKAIAKYSKIIVAAQERKATEADTRQIIVDFLSEGLGYDKFAEITAEQRIKGHFVDFAVSVDSKTVFLIEAKPIGTSLNDNHLYQVVNYAQGHGIEWALLTNGNTWALHHLSYGKPVENELAFCVEITDQDEKPKPKIDKLFLLTRESFTKNLISDFWKQKLALSIPNIARVLLKEPSLKRIRLDLKKETGHSIAIEDLKKVLAEKLTV